MQDNNIRRLRGKPAIEAAHENLAVEDEIRLDALISHLYSVESDEAADIHASYHIERILFMLEKRTRKNGMTKEALVQKIQYMDISGTARQVAKGKLTEAAASDALFRQLSSIENPNIYDRYINFYG
jgi:hypothetical protein